MISSDCFKAHTWVAHYYHHHHHHHHIFCPLLPFRYEECREKLLPFLRKVGFNPKKDIHFIPVSGITGSNLKFPEADKCPWYTGPPFIQYIDDLPPLPSRNSTGPLRLPITDRYKVRCPLVPDCVQWCCHVCLVATPGPPPPPLRRSTIHICLFQILRDTPLRMEMGYPPITGFWKGSQQITPPPYHRFLEGKLAKLPPKWRKIENYP